MSSYYVFPREAGASNFYALIRRITAYIRRINELEWADGEPRIENARTDLRVREKIHEFANRDCFFREWKPHKITDSFWVSWDETATHCWVCHYTHVKAPFRQPQGYVKSADHRSKTPTEADLNRKAWRIERDERRRCGYQRTAPRWAKDVSKRSRRAWERQCLEKGNFDDLCRAQEREFLDRWLWD